HARVDDADGRAAADAEGSGRGVHGAQAPLAVEQRVDALVEEGRARRADPRGVEDGVVAGGGVPAGRVPPAAVPTAGVPAGAVPARGVPSGRVPAAAVPSAGVPTRRIPSGRVPAAAVPAGGVEAGGAVGLHEGDEGRVGHRRGHEGGDVGGVDGGDADGVAALGDHAAHGGDEREVDAGRLEAHDEVRAHRGGRGRGGGRREVRGGGRGEEEEGHDPDRRDRARGVPGEPNGSHGGNAPHPGRRPRGLPAVKSSRIFPLRFSGLSRSRRVGSRSILYSSPARKAGSPMAQTATLADPATRVATSTPLPVRAYVTLLSALGGIALAAGVWSAAYLWPRDPTGALLGGLFAILVGFAFLLERRALVLHFRNLRTVSSFDEPVVLLALALLPPFALVPLVACSMTIVQLAARRVAIKAFFNVGAYTTAAAVAAALAAWLGGSLGWPRLAAATAGLAAYTLASNSLVATLFA